MNIKFRNKFTNLEIFMQPFDTEVIQFHFRSEIFTSNTIL